MSKDKELHYERLISAGYAPEIAEEFVRNLYGGSFRDVLQERKEKEPEQEQDSEASGGEIEIKVDTVIASESEIAADDTKPQIDQKVLSNTDFGIIRNIGSRFITVEWMTKNKERMALRTFQSAVDAGNMRLIPSIRTARKRNG